MTPRLPGLDYFGGFYGTCRADGETRPARGILGLRDHELTWILAHASAVVVEHAEIDMSRGVRIEGDGIEVGSDRAGRRWHLKLIATGGGRGRPSTHPH